MPASFQPTPVGIIGDAQRRLRNSHAALLSGTCLQVLHFIPSWLARSVAAPPPNPAGQRLLPYAAWAWLLLPAMRADRDQLPLQQHLFRFIVNVGVLGGAFEALVVGGLDLSPCSPGVARKRVQQLAAQLYSANAAAFTVVGADWYLVEMGPPVLPPGTLRVDPAQAVDIEIEHVLDASDGLGLLGFLEPLLWPRVLLADRQAGGGWSTVVAIAEQHIFPSMPPAVVIRLGGAARGRELARVLATGVPGEMLMSFEPGVAGWTALASALAHAAAGTPHEHLGGTGVLLAIEHLHNHKIVFRDLKARAAAACEGVCARREGVCALAARGD